ncbi:MAG: YgiQ family radical SAM protein [Verrucomicrobia bacterium]|nr:YgiQ family radical SAM protein [Verrucomicrobiota bacterium]
MANKPKTKPVDAKAFLPMSRAEMDARGWDALDVLIITGDAYVDHPSFGTAMIGRYLEAKGLRVGVVAQPDWTKIESIAVMGAPKLFVGVTAGNLDSMLSNYTAARHKRKDDVYSAGGVPGKRPNHAAVVYSQMARRAFPGVPVVLGGMEASMRRVAHYDFWEDKLRPSIMADAKPDVLIYGMGERAVIEIADRLRAGNRDFSGIRGTALFLGAKATAAADFSECLILPSWEDLQADKKHLMRLTKVVEAQQTPYCGKRLVQMHGNRAVVQEPPAMPVDGPELDALYELPFQRAAHPSYTEPVPGFATIKDSIIVSRGCAGGCTFCGLGFHQGKFLSSRSVESVTREINKLAESDSFRGTISDLGGPTANLYAAQNGHAEECKKCHRPSCLWPSICPVFKVDEQQQLDLLRSSRTQPGVKHVFVQSGIRMDVALRTPTYLKELVQHHVSGHMKVAPEHMNPEVLRKMRKPAGDFQGFMEKFFELSEEAGKEQYLVPYFISSFHGCTEKEMGAVESFLKKEKWNLQQVQDFIPLPMTGAAAMYVTGLDINSEESIPVVRNAGDRERQKRMLRPNAAHEVRVTGSRSGRRPTAADAVADLDVVD